MARSARKLHAVDASPKAGAAADSAREPCAYTPDMVQAMQRATVALFARWGVNADEAAILLGGISSKTFRRWRDGEFGRVGRDLADRMSLLLGIHKALRILYREPARGYRWIGAANQTFGGASALEVMLGGGIEDLRRVRSYLDSVRG